MLRPEKGKFMANANDRNNLVSFYFSNNRPALKNKKPNYKVDLGFMKCPI